jgi:hypothetical protein
MVVFHGLQCHGLRCSQHLDCCPGELLGEGPAPSPGAWLTALVMEYTNCITVCNI